MRLNSFHSRATVRRRGAKELDDSGLVFGDHGRLTTQQTCRRNRLQDPHCAISWTQLANSLGATGFDSVPAVGNGIPASAYISGGLSLFLSRYSKCCVHFGMALANALPTAVDDRPVSHEAWRKPLLICGISV
jgi:hypothetical protein